MPKTLLKSKKEYIDNHLMNFTPPSMSLGLSPTPPPPPGSARAVATNVNAADAAQSVPEGVQVRFQAIPIDSGIYFSCVVFCLVFCFLITLVLAFLS